MSISGEPRILLVEDSPSDASIIRNLLLQEGLPAENFVHADRLSAGLESLAHDKIDVVLLDLHLPDSHGMETFLELQRRWPDIPVVVLSGLDDEARAVRSVQRGAQDYLNKSELEGRLLLRSIHYAIERKRGEVTLRDGREFAEGLIETAHALVILLDVRGGILRFNSFAEHVSGYASSEVIGTDWLKALFPESDRAAVKNLVQRATDDRETYVGIYPIVAKDGSLHDIRWAGKAIRDGQGQVRFVLFTGHDISDLRAAQQRALHSERLAAIGQMMAGLAHESRNALQRSQSCLEMLRLSVKDRTDALDYIERIQDAQDHLGQLYEEVRSYSAPIRLALEQRSLRDLLFITWENLIAEREGRDATLICPEPDVIVQCKLDRHRIEQVFRNILENSLSAADDPVEIQVCWETAELNGLPAVTTTIRDNGPGLTEEQKRRLFEPFYTTKTHGTGLGMAICQRIVDAHGGRLELGDSEQPGAELKLTLPLAARQHAS